MYYTSIVIYIYCNMVISIDKDLAIKLRDNIQLFEKELLKNLKDGAVCCGISRAQLYSLKEISLHEKISITELARALSLDSSTLSRTINTMVKAGLVKRNNDPNDRRYVSLCLTEKGREYYNQLNDKCFNYLLDIIKLIPEEKQKQVIDNVNLFINTALKYRKNNMCCKT